MYTLDEVKEQMYRVLYAFETTGAVIESMDDNGCVTVRLDLSPAHNNSGGRVMGGAIFTLADFAFASSAYANGIFTTAINCSIEYLSAGRGSFLTSKGYIDKAGRSIVFGGADVYDETGKMIARLSVQAFRIEKPMV